MEHNGIWVMCRQCGQGKGSSQKNEMECVLGGPEGWVSRSKYMVQEEINDEEDQEEMDPES